MAPGALPPAFPSIEMGGQHYWVRGLVSNTRLERVWAAKPRRDAPVLQVDLWSARSVMGVLDRTKGIQ